MNMILTLLFTAILSLTGVDVQKDTVQTKDSNNNKVLDLTKTVIVNADYAMQPVRPLHRPQTQAIDTLDTVNEYVKVALYSDNTWQYIKLKGYVADQDIFKTHWETTSPNPYQKTLEELPSVWSIWMVDSLDQYHVPYKGSVYSKYGVRRGRPHQGVDIPLSTGDPVYATFTGQVRVSRFSKGYGNLVVIRHENGLETFYGHLSERKVEVGEWVNAGQIIGLGGSTGRSSGPHLHFETRYQGFSFDPQWIIDFKTGELRHRLFILKKKYFSQYNSYDQNFDDEILNEEDDKREAAEREAMRWHVIRSGDTLYGLALANKTTVAEICRLNNISAKSTLRIGQKLRVR